MPYKVRLTGSRQRMYAHQLIDAAPDQSTVTIVGGDRTIDQNAKMWAMLTDVALSRPEGRKWTPEAWKCAYALTRPSGAVCGRSGRFWAVSTWLQNISAKQIANVRPDRSYL